MKGANSPENPLSPEILKLIEKLDKDPNSKLFMPLAEEYLKSGMLEEAAMVLTDGLKIHPRFVSAKVTLGKVLLGKGQIKEARAQFEEVIAANPDNLFAHRKLARIYRDSNEFEKAKASCRAVLSLNPKEPEMKSLMGELEQLSKDLAEPQEVPKAEAFDPQEVSNEAKNPVLGVREDALDSPSPQELELSRPNEAASDLSSQSGGEVKDLGERDQTVQDAAAEVETESLADLYIEQGYYDKGKAIYAKLLMSDPDNSGLKRKLEQTETLINLFSKEQEPPVQNISQTEAPSDIAVEMDSATSAKEEGKILGNRIPHQTDRAKRLEAWLESLRKGMEK